MSTHVDTRSEEVKATWSCVLNYYSINQHKQRGMSKEMFFGAEQTGQFESSRNAVFADCNNASGTCFDTEDLNTIFCLCLNFTKKKK